MNPEVDAVENEEAEPTEIQSEMAAGFAEAFGEKAPETKQAVAGKIEKEPKAKEVADETKADDTPAPETVTLTKAELESLNAKVALIPALEQSIKRMADESGGKLGGLMQTVKDLQSQIKRGESISKAQLKKLDDAGFGDVSAAMTVKDDEIQTEEAPPKATEFDPAKLKDEMQQTLQAERAAQALEMTKLRVAMSHPDWEDLTKTPAFYAWRDSHPADVVERIRTGRDPSTNQYDAKFLVDALTGFKGYLKAEADKAKPPKQTDKRLEKAITPTTGAPSAGRQTTSEDADKRKGFLSAFDT